MISLLKTLLSQGAMLHLLIMMQLLKQTINLVLILTCIVHQPFKNKKSIQLSDDVFALAASFFSCFVLSMNHFDLVKNLRRIPISIGVVLKDRIGRFCPNFLIKQHTLIINNDFVPLLEAKLFLKQLLSNIEESVLQ